MYVPSWPGLGAVELMLPRRSRPAPFPIAAEGRLCFYRARSAIYHLFRALRLGPEDLVLAPDYHSGGEVEAIRAAGCRVRLYPIDRSLRPDLDALDGLSRSGARALLVIHYLGWAQPMEPLLKICRERGMVLIEDCALCLLSRDGDRPLGTYGDYAVFCLYKTLPLPNGGLLVQNGARLAGLAGLPLRPCGMRSVAGRAAELTLERLRCRMDAAGAGLFMAKRTMGRIMNRMKIDTHPVGDVGFDSADLLFGMSRFCETLMRRLDYATIVQKRRRNYTLLRDAVADIVSPLFDDLPEGICPLFFPILVEDKAAAARALRARGIEAVEFWNRGRGDSDAGRGSSADFLHQHVLEVPIHQDLGPSHIWHMAETIRALEPMFDFKPRARRSCAS